MGMGVGMGMGMGMGIDLAHYSLRILSASVSHDRRWRARRGWRRIYPCGVCSCAGTPSGRCVVSIYIVSSTRM